MTQGYHFAEVAGAGADAPTLFLFHGTGGDETQFLDLGGQLKPGARLVAPRGDVAEQGASRLAARGLTLQQSGVGPLPSLSGDPVLLRQVWQNHQSNAFKISPTEPHPRNDIAGSGTGDGQARRATDQGRLEVGVCQPELLLGIDGRHDGGHLVAGVGEQLEDADEHAVVPKQVFVGDGFAKRYHLIAVVPRDVVGGSVGRIRLPQV